MTVSEFAKLTGDFRSLSAVDLRVLALTYQLEKEHCGIGHIKTRPTKQVRTWLTHLKVLKASMVECCLTPSSLPQSTFDWDLNQHLDGYSVDILSTMISINSWLTVTGWPTVTYWSTLNRMSANTSWLSTEWLLTEMLIKCQQRLQ